MVGLGVGIGSGGSKVATYYSMGTREAGESGEGHHDDKVLHGFAEDRRCVCVITHINYPAL